MEKVVNGILPRSIKVISGLIDTISNSNKFDLILYIDVLEHLENDQYELEKASDYLKKGGNLIVLAPAHNFLFSPFDTAVGHFRRYNKRMIKGWSFLSLDVSKVFYLDSVGMIASLMNKTLLKQTSPTLNQISFWDKTIIPISKVIDPLLLFLFGKTIISIYEKK